MSFGVERLRTTEFNVAARLASMNIPIAARLISVFALYACLTVVPGWRENRVAQRYLQDYHQIAIVLVNRPGEPRRSFAGDLPPFYGPGAVRVGSTVPDGTSGRRSAAESARGAIAPYSAGVRYPSAL